MFYNEKILVLVQNYPDNDGGVALIYVHVRNKYYIQHDIDVTVLNFRHMTIIILTILKLLLRIHIKKKIKNMM